MSMRLSNAFTLPLPVDEAWGVLTDVTRLAPCLPGAFVTSVEGHEFEGGLTVKVGPITASYGGRARFTELDDAGHRAVLVGEGREAKGRGGASLTLEVLAEAAGPTATQVRVETDLSISGRLAQFGHGAVADISSRMIDQFVANLERELLGGAPAAPTAPTTGPVAGRRPAAPGAPGSPAAPAPAPVDLAAADWPDDERSTPAPAPAGRTSAGPVGPGAPADALDLASIIGPQLHRLRQPALVAAGFAAGLRIGLALGRSRRTGRGRA